MFFSFFFWLSQKTQNSSLSLFFSSLVSRPTTFGRISPELTWLCFFISLSFRYYSSSCHSLLFYVIWLGNVWESVLINLFSFYRHLKSTQFHTVRHICSHHFVPFRISVLSSHCFYGASLLACLPNGHTTAFYPSLFGARDFLTPPHYLLGPYGSDRLAHNIIIGNSFMIWFCLLEYKMMKTGHLKIWNVNSKTVRGQHISESRGGKRATLLASRNCLRDGHI